MKDLPDPSNIIFGEMMYSSDQMREYAEAVLASHQEPSNSDRAVIDSLREEISRLLFALVSRQEQPAKCNDCGTTTTAHKEGCLWAPHLIDSAGRVYRQAPASLAVTVPDEREAFDKWYQAHGNGSSYYSSFGAWQARAALAASLLTKGK